MKLKVWLKSKRKTASQLAKELAVDVTTVSRWNRGVTVPSRSTMKTLYKLTQGEVTASDFFVIEHPQSKEMQG